MAKILFSKADLEKHIKLDSGVIDQINLFGTPAQLLGEDLEVEVFPNRPDLLSLQGFIRAIKAYLGKEVGMRKYKVKSPEKNYTVNVQASVQEVRPYTACAIVKGLTFNDSSIKQIIDLQEKIHATIGRQRKKLALGIYPLEKIKLPITYEARKPADIKFRPLESEREMTAQEILKRHPTGQAYAHLLEKNTQYPIFIDAKKSILSMPPIINSYETGRITQETKEVFVECSGQDLEILKKTLNIIVTMLADLGGIIYAMNINYPKKIITPDLTPEKMKISLENTNKLLGLDLKEKDLEKLLPRMGYDYKKSVIIPPWRTDILHEVDIIEDLAIAYGYNNFKPQIPKIASIGQATKENTYKNKLAEILIGLGLLEISSYHLVKEEELTLFKMEKIALESAKTEFKVLRPSLLLPALRTFAENKDHEYPQRIFELGPIFKIEESKETGIHEEDHLLIACSPGNFTELKQILDYIMKSLAQEWKIKESTHPGCIEGRTASILINEKTIGFLGEMHPEMLRSWNIKMPLACLEISLAEFYPK